MAIIVLISAILVIAHFADKARKSNSNKYIKNLSQNEIDTVRSERDSQLDESEKIITIVLPTISNDYKIDKE